MIMRSLAILILLFTAAMLSAVVSVAPAGNLQFFRSSPMAHFEKDDYEQMMKAVTAR